jgi:hypothetical protein
MEIIRVQNIIPPRVTKLDDIKAFNELSAREGLDYCPLLGIMKYKPLPHDPNPDRIAFCVVINESGDRITDFTTIDQAKWCEQLRLTHMEHYRIDTYIFKEFDYYLQRGGCAMSLKEE